MKYLTKEAAADKILRILLAENMKASIAMDALAFALLTILFKCEDKKLRIECYLKFSQNVRDVLENMYSSTDFVGSNSKH